MHYSDKNAKKTILPFTRKCKNDYICKFCTNSMRETTVGLVGGEKLPAFTEPKWSLS